MTPSTTPLLNWRGLDKLWFMAQLMDAMFDPPNILVWHKVSSAILIFYFYFKVDIFGLFGFIPILIKTKS